MPPSPAFRRTLLAATALCPLLLGPAAATAGAAELTGTVVHVTRTTTPSLYLASGDRPVIRLRGSETLLSKVSRGRRITATTSGTTSGSTVTSIVASAGFAASVAFPVKAEWRGTDLVWRLDPSFYTHSRSTDVIMRDGVRVDRATVAGGTDLRLTWTLSTSTGAVTATRGDILTGAPAPAPTPTPAPTAPAPTPTPAPPPAGTSPVTAPRSVAITGLTSRQIYHSPQTPGYTSWLGAWMGTDASTLFASFVQVTGSASETAFVGSSNWTGVSMTNRFMRSTDGGQSWQNFRADPFKGAPHAYSAQATTGLRDGTILRRVNAEDQQAAGVPERGTAYVQRLAPGASSWSAPLYLMDPDRYTYQLTRIQSLRDGRLIASGNYWDVPAGTRSGRLPMDRQGWLLMVSSDQGRTWKWALQEPPAGSRVPPNEWDVAEMPSGDLLAVMRTYDPANRANQFRRQAVLRRSTAGWTMETPRTTPFPHSGHPELIATREGVILHIATTGTHWTADGGRTWTALAARSAGYYPTSVQAGDGTIYVLSHRGGDNDYMERDQAVLMDRFKLSVTR